MIDLHPVIRFAGLPGIISIDEILRLVCPVRIQVANRHDPGRIEFQNARHIVNPGYASRADGPDIDPVARRVSAEYAGGYDGRKGTPGKGSRQRGFYGTAEEFLPADG